MGSIGGPPRQDPQVRFARYVQVDENTGCHNWTGALTHNGYGQFSTGDYRNKARAHRVAYEWAKGPIPEGMQIDHLCRNRRCVNPEHLEAVTGAENTRRGNSPSAISARTGVFTCGHKATPDNIRIQGSRRTRTCAICANEWARLRKAAKRAEFKLARSVPQPIRFEPPPPNPSIETES